MQKNISQNKDVMVDRDKHIATGRASVQHGFEQRNEFQPRAEPAWIGRAAFDLPDQPHATHFGGFMTALAQAPILDRTEDRWNLISHAVASIEASDLFLSPFPYIVFRDFFPADIYRELIGNVPSEGYDPIKADQTRMALRLYGEHVGHIEPARRELWAAVSAMLTSKEVENAIRNRLHEGLVIRAKGDKVNGPDDLKLVAKPVLYKDSDGYQIKPHPDTRKKVVTMQLYCPADESQADLGTTLYQASLKGLLHIDSYCLEPVKTIPFLPNLGYAFVVLKAYHSLSQMSWHGRPKVKTTAPRVTILNTFYRDETVGF